MKRLSLVALAVVSTALAAGSAAAQAGTPGTGAGQSDTRGLAVGINLSRSAIGSSDADAAGRTSGAGLGMTLGYGVSDAVSLFLRADYAYRMSHVDLGARYSFGGASSALRPYLEAALTRTGTSAFTPETAEHSLHSRGTGFTGGAGVEYFVRRNLAVDVGVSHSRGRFTGGDFDGDSFSATRLNLGVRWRP